MREDTFNYIYMHNISFLSFTFTTHNNVLISSS